MNAEIDRYLSTLLSFTPGHKRGNQIGGDYASLIHVPVSGPERVYSIAFGEEVNVLTTAKYQETLWDALEESDSDFIDSLRPQVDVLQAEVGADHPVFEFLEVESLSACANFSDGAPGLDYLLPTDVAAFGQASVVECWEPFGRDELNWISMIGAMQTLVLQYEFAAAGGTAE